MNSHGDIVVFVLVGIIGLISYKGFSDRTFFERYLLNVGKILDGKQYERFFTSAFLHADWNHLLINGLSLVFVGPIVVNFESTGIFALVYFLSIVGSHGLSLGMNRHYPMYRAVGASGAVSGLVFYSIMLYPSLLVFGIIPGWIYGVLFLAYSIYGISSAVGNIGHEAHIGGALAGLVLAFILHLDVVILRLPVFIILFVIPIVLLFLYVKRPDLLTVKGLKASPLNRKPRRLNSKRLVSEDRTSLQYELNLLLEKVGDLGMKGLTQKEIQRLNELSKVIKTKSGPRAPGGPSSDR